MVERHKSVDARLRGYGERSSAKHHPSSPRKAGTHTPQPIEKTRRMDPRFRATACTDLGACGPRRKCRSRIRPFKDARMDSRWLHTQSLDAFTSLLISR